MSEPRWRIVQADLRTADLAQLVGSGYHAVLCDPPYGLSPDGRARTWDDLDGADGRGFMNKAWDAAVPGATFWRSVRRCLRPGAHLLAFGGTRTYHRLVCGIEDAGLEVRDQLAWLYGSGFPKSHDVSKAIDAAAGAERKVIGTRVKRGMGGSQTFAQDAWTSANVGLINLDVTAPATPEAVRWNGYGTALKPAHEPIVLAREPLDGTVAHNALTHGCGALAIDATRVAHDGSGRWGAGKRPGGFGDVGAAIGSGGPNGAFNPAGRWPANVLLDKAAAEMLDERDTGGASRFFYIAKASRSEREAGCDELPTLATVRYNVEQGQGQLPQQTPRKATAQGNHHPTVKPIELATYLARMLLPPPGPEPRRILVPFSGSGSEMIGAVLAGWDEVVGVEMSEEYIAIATARLKHWAKRTAPKKKTTKPQPRKRAMPVQMEMF